MPPRSWDSLYTTELSNHATNPSDIGTVWFDDSDAEAKLLEFLEARTPEGESGGEEEDGHDNGDRNRNRNGAAVSLDKAADSFLDLGCGNGSLLFALRDEGWRGRLLGVDYSPKSVDLARQIAATKAAERQEDNEGETLGVDFEEWDVLAGPYDTVLGGAQADGWDVVLDKGTFDAISLSDERDASGRRIVEGYRGRALKLVRPGGLLLITSCNWTEAELKTWFEGESAEGDDGRFVQVGRVKYPSFSFGGVKGQTISTLCFRKER